MVPAALVRARSGCHRDSEQAASREQPGAHTASNERSGCTARRGTPQSTDRRSGRRWGLGQVTALRAKRAELAGEVQAVEKQAAQLRANLVHLDATLRLFDPSADPDAIPARRPYRRRRWFSDGELPRRILDTLRTSSEELSANDLAERIIAQKGFVEGDAHTLLTIRKSVQSYLRHQSGTLVRQAGRNGRDGLWRVV